MKTKLTTAAFAACTAGLCLAAPLGETVKNSAFEEINGAQPAFWQLDARGFTAGRGFGHNGSGGLVWESAGPQKSRCGARQDVVLEKGVAYRFSALVRTENFKCAHGGACLCVEWYDANGKWLAGGYTHGLNDANLDWTPIEGATRAIPANAARMTVQLYVNKGASGKVCFDNVVIAPLRRDPVAFVFSSAYRNLAAKGPVRFHAALFPNAVLTAADLRAVYTYVDAAGRTKQVPPTRFAADEATLALDAADLALGTHPVVCELFDKSGALLGKASCDFTRVETLPRRRVYVDEHQRCIVDGKPFFPLGMYAGQIKTNWLDVYAKGPFNCLMPYARAQPAHLDQCQARGLMCFVNLKNEILGSPWARRMNYTTQEQVDDFFRREILKVKDHPALLGWYVNDEAPVTQVPMRTHLYSLFCKYDDQHPTWAVLDRLHDLREFIPTYDVLGMDPYPVALKPLAHITEFIRGTQKCNFSDKPLWNVPQTFNWGWYRKQEAAVQRFPTEAEISSMNWQHVACGANGLISYCFHALLRDVKPEEFDHYWGVVCRPNAEVKKMIPVLLSVDPAPAVTGAPEDMPVRVWAKDGDLYVLACNVRPEPLKTTLKIASGAWRAVSAEVGPMQRMAAPDALALDLPAIGVSFMRLTPSGNSK